MSDHLIKSPWTGRLCAGVAAIGATLALAGATPDAVAQNRPAAKAPPAKAPQQVVNPAPVNYWMDVGTGAEASRSGGGMMGMMMGGMMGGGAQNPGGFWGGRDNWFGAANADAAGPRADIAIFDRRQPGAVNATQAIPAGLRLGASLPLLPPPPPAQGERTPFEEDRDPEPPEMPEGRFKMTIKAYWGCGSSVRPGQPRVQTMEFDSQTGFSGYGSTVQGRYERDRGATSNSRSSIWPNRTSAPRPQGGASLVGEHRVTGNGLPDSLAFAIPAAQDFMPQLNLRTSGQQSGVIGLTWDNLPTASAYFAAASGFGMKEGASEDDREMVMITWSASELPESGAGLLTYLSNTNQDRYLQSKVILPAGTTSCQIPSGIFAEAMMVNIGAVAYGRELNLVHPPRPADPRVPWNQEWTARIRVKSEAQAMLMAGMGGMGGMGEGASRTGSAPRGSAASPAQPSPTVSREEQERRARCEEARRQQATRGAVGGLLGGLAGRIAAGSLPPGC